MSKPFFSSFRQLYFYVFVLLLAITTSTKTSLQAEDDFVIFAPPKCGTHLIGKVAELMLNKKGAYYLSGLGDFELALQLIELAKENNQFVVTHHYSDQILEVLKERNYKIIFIIRDPRDQLISMMHWMHEGQWGQFPVAHMKNEEEQITEMITGDRYGWRCYNGCIGKNLFRLQKYPKDSVFITRFENLVGPKGGGSQKNQLKEIKHLARFLNHDLSKEEIEMVAENVFGGTLTFRNGTIGQWKDHFNQNHKILYKTLYNKNLLQLGYEKDGKW